MLVANNRIDPVIVLQWDKLVSSAFHNPRKKPIFG